MFTNPMNSSDTGDLPETVVLKGSLRGAAAPASICLNFALIEAFVGVSPAFVAIGLSIAALMRDPIRSSLAAMGLYGGLILAVVCGVYAASSPSEWPLRGLALLLAGAIVSLLSPFTGGERLVLDRDGAVLTTLWMTKRFSWTIATPRVNSDPLGKSRSVSLQLAPASPAKAKGAVVLISDRYGMSPEALADLMNRFRARALAGGV
jgi:hypothetical protein